MPTIDPVTAPAATPHPAHSWRDGLSWVQAAAHDRLPTAVNRLSQTISSVADEQLTRLDTYCTLLPLRGAIARTRLQVRAYAFDHEHRGTRLLAWAAAIDALTHTLRTIPSQHTDADRIAQLTNTAVLLRAIAGTERVRYAARLDPAERLCRTQATPEIEAAAAAQLDALCRPSLTLAGRIRLLSQLAIRLYPTLGQAVHVLRDLA
jgi:hypothetical protein